MTGAVSWRVTLLSLRSCGPGGGLGGQGGGPLRKGPCATGGSVGRVLWREFPDTPVVLVPFVPARPVLVPILAAGVVAAAGFWSPSPLRCVRTPPLVVAYFIFILRFAPPQRLPLRDAFVATGRAAKRTANKVAKRAVANHRQQELHHLAFAH